MSNVDILIMLLSPVFGAAMYFVWVRVRNAVATMNKKSFTLSFHRDDPPNRTYPTGYWVAATLGGECEGVGSAPEDAMANLIDCLLRELNRERTSRRNPR